MNKIANKSKIIVRLGTFSSTIIACSNSVIAVVFNNTRTISVSLHTSFKMSVIIVTTIGAFWCVSRRCADKKLFNIFSKINCSVVNLQWRAHVINGFEIVRWTVIYNLKKKKKKNYNFYKIYSNFWCWFSFYLTPTDRNCGIHLTTKSVKTFWSCASDW